MFNLWRLLARTKTTEEIITELLFADDSTLLAHMEEALQHIINCFSDAAKNLGSIIPNNATVSKDLDNLLSKASSSFRRLSKRAWLSHSPCLSTKTQIYTEPSFPPSCTMQKSGSSIRSRSLYMSGFTSAACAQSLASNGKITCQTKKSSREPACQEQSPSCFRCSCTGLATSQGRMENICMPKAVFFSKLQQGKSNHAAPRKL